MHIHLHLEMPIAAGPAAPWAERLGSGERGWEERGERDGRWEQPLPHSAAEPLCGDASSHSSERELPETQMAASSPHRACTKSLLQARIARWSPILSRKEMQTAPHCRRRAAAAPTGTPSWDLRRIKYLLNVQAHRGLPETRAAPTSVV